MSFQQAGLLHASPPGQVVLPLQQPYDSAYLVLHCRPCSFTIRVGNRKEIVSTGRLKPCTDNTAGPGVPSRLGRLPSTVEAAKLTAHCHSDSPAMKRFSFSDRWCPRLPSDTRRSGVYSLEMILSHRAGGFLHIQRQFSSTEEVPAMPADTASQIRSLTLLPLTPEIRGNPCGGCLHPC
jgi:hypothetical protein